ncbi:unnamed protein product [Didymodactylos carnosus]|uniref:Uncharacterized protein n=1 Tax=Didymodactylos carnosus TaxID=1234261 RepID=A0A8S2SP06_9BILA|nr:unnamed protein product [Didymodactylos carnosus]CAF4243763.1 unnamed protein product [Didymodactylos carnosus]
MEVLKSDSGDFHLKNIQECSPLPGEEEILDGELDEDNFSSVSGDVEQASPSISHVEIKSEKKEESSITHSPPITTSTSTSTKNNLTNADDSQSKTDYSCHRDRIVKELKEYEERWLAHRNFLLYTQSFAMKPEDRERVFSQLLTNSNSNPDERDHRHMSKDERDRYLSNQAALYSHYSHSPHLYNFHNFNPYLAERLLPSATSATAASFLPENKDNRFNSWQLSTHSPSNSQTGAISTVGITTTTASASTTSSIHQPTAPTEQSSSRSPSSSDSGNQSNSGSTTEWTYEEQFKQVSATRIQYN